MVQTVFFKNSNVQRHFCINRTNLNALTSPCSSQGADVESVNARHLAVKLQLITWQTAFIQKIRSTREVSYTFVVTHIVTV